MPKIRAESVEAHHDLVWSELTDALDLLIAETDFETLGFARIAEQAGMTRTALYTYARDKHALLAGVVERASRSAVEEVRTIARGGGPASERLGSIVLVLLRLLSSGPVRVALGRQLTTGTAGDGDVPAPLAPLGALLGEVGIVVIDGAAAGEFRPVDDVPLTVDLLGGSVLAAARHAAGGEDRLQAVAGRLTDLLVHALR